MSNKTGAKRKKKPTNLPEEFIDTGTLETPILDVNEEVGDEFEDSKKLGINAKKNLPRHMERETKSKFLPDAKIVAGNDPDSDLIEASMSGDSSVVGGNPTPDQSDVDVIGEAVGLEYEDNEELNLLDKVKIRDEWRWELEPESSEDFKERSKSLSTPKHRKGS